MRCLYSFCGNSPAIYGRESATGEVSILASMAAPAEKVLLPDDERMARLPDVPSASIEVISATPNWVELLMSSTREAAEIAQAFVAKLEADLPHELINSIRQALRELLLNAVEWGGKLDPNQKVRIARLRYPRMLLYFVADPGAGFSFEGLAHAAVHQTSAEAIARVAIVRDELGMRPGGFGIAMARAIADELLYNEAQNEVVLIKYLSEAMQNPAGAISAAGDP
jgi:anti-sigma regulatory factor (Ser/Thr protein kinase)